MEKPRLVALLCASLALQGCQVPAPRELPNSLATAPVAGRLPLDTRIIPATLPIELLNVELSKEARAKLEEERSRAVGRPGPIGLGGISGALPLCILPPLCVAVIAGGVALGTIAQSAHESLRAERTYPSVPTEFQSGRLAWLLRERATAAALAERAQRLVQSESKPTRDYASYPLLVVRIAEAEFRYEHGSGYVVLTAQAQAFPAAGTIWPVTEHRQSFPYRPSLGTAHEERWIDEAVDVLTYSVVLSYFPAHPVAVETQGWLRTRERHDVAAYQEYLRQYPNGRFAANAHAYLAVLAKEEAEWRDRRERAQAQSRERQEHAERLRDCYPTHRSRWCDN